MDSRDRKGDVSFAVAWNIVRAEVGPWRVIARLDGEIGEGAWCIDCSPRESNGSQAVASVSGIILAGSVATLRRMFVVDATLAGFELRFDVERAPVSCHVSGDTRSSSVRIELRSDGKAADSVEMTVTRDRSAVDVQPVHGTVVDDGDSVRLLTTDPAIASSAGLGTRHVIGAVELSLRTIG